MKNKIFIIVLALISIGIILFRTRPIDFDQKIKLAVLEQIETETLWRVLMYIPESVSERFSFKLFEEKADTKIYCVNYFYKSVFYSFYYSTNENGNISNIKKGLVSAPSSKFDLTDFIQKETINKVAKDFNWSNSVLIRNLCFFLSNFCEDNYSSPLENRGDYEDIIKMHPLSEDKNIILTPLLSIEEVKYLLDQENTNVYYYWYYDQGLMKFSYTLINGNIERIESTFVGYLGNEVIRL